MRTVDGDSVIDNSALNEILYWEGLTQAGYPVDVILTNQLLAGAEYWNNSVHSALRGGISNGVTAANPSALFKATAIVSIFPMIASDVVSRKLRGGEVYTDEDAARFAALVLVHEIGHQLFHYDHPYGVSACVMAPTKLLYFRQWEGGLSATECRKADAPAMARGAVSIPCDFC